MLDDASLIAAFVAGDRAALGALVERYQGEAFDLARCVTRATDLAEDATQEAFMRLMRSAGSWRGEGTFRAWFFRVVVNAARDVLRGRQRAERHASSTGAVERVGDRPGTGLFPSAAEAAVVHAEVRAVVSGLPDGFQLPLVLHRSRSHRGVKFGCGTCRPFGAAEIASSESRGAERSSAPNGAEMVSTSVRMGSRPVRASFSVSAGRWRPVPSLSL